MLQPISKNKETTRRLFSYIVALIASLTFLTIVLTGCSDQSNLIAPTNSVNKVEPNWISLPMVDAQNGISVLSMPIFQASKEIKGEVGGKIKIDEKYQGPNGEVKVKAEIEFPKDAFEGTKYITMILDTQFGLATFSPHASFNKAAKYSAEFTGLDLTGVNPNDVSFVYQAEDGTYEYIDFSKIEVDVNNGKLKVKDAKLPHFSRYGFVN